MSPRPVVRKGGRGGSQAPPYHLVELLACEEKESLRAAAAADFSGWVQPLPFIDGTYYVPNGHPSLVGHPGHQHFLRSFVLGVDSPPSSRCIDRLIARRLLPCPYLRRNSKGARVPENTGGLQIRESPGVASHNAGLDLKGIRGVAEQALCDACLGRLLSNGVARISEIVYRRATRPRWCVSTSLRPL